MSFHGFNVEPPAETIATGSHIIVLSTPFSDGQQAGIYILIATAAISTIALITLLVMLGVSAVRNSRTASDRHYLRTSVVVYFVCLLLSDLIGSIGSLFSSKWAIEGGISIGPICTAQGVLKNAGNLGSALWTSVIAVHTFSLLVLKRRTGSFTLYSTLVVVWLFVAVTILLGPYAIQNTAAKGPYFGIGGYWCWITEGYLVERITLEYLWMFIAGFVSFVAYFATFLSLRGNLFINGSRVQFRIRRAASAWRGDARKNFIHQQASAAAVQMLIYPVVYTTLILPISLCRFLTWTGHTVSYELFVFADAVFLLSGFVNAILFYTTRRIGDSTPSSNASRSSSAKSDLESFGSYETNATTFKLPSQAEKAPVSSYEDKNRSVIPEVIVTAPQKTYLSDSFVEPYLPKRSVSLAPTMSSSYSEISLDYPPPTWSSTTPVLPVYPRKGQPAFELVTGQYAGFSSAGSNRLGFTIPSAQRPPRPLLLQPSQHTPHL